jgi:hypothetical protein
MHVLVNIIDALIPIFAIFILFGLPIVGFFILRWRKMSLEHKSGGKLPKNTQQKIDFLLEENEEIKEELEQMKFLLGIGKKDSESLDISKFKRKKIQDDSYTNYEKEQIRIDNQDKLNY